MPRKQFIGNWFISIFTQAHSTKNYCLLSTKKVLGEKKHINWMSLFSSEKRLKIGGTLFALSFFKIDTYSIAKVTNHDPAGIPDRKLNWGFWNNNNICKRNLSSAKGNTWNCEIVPLLTPYHALCLRLISNGFCTKKLLFHDYRPQGSDSFISRWDSRDVYCLSSVIKDWWKI